MRKIQNFIFSVIFAIVGGIIAIFVYTHYIDKPLIVT